MSDAIFWSAFLLVLFGVIVAWVRARSALDTAIGHDQHWLPSAYQLRAWEKQRLVRAEGNRRMG